MDQFLNAEFSIGGRDSRFKSKPSYNIKLSKKDRFGGYRSLKLRAAVTDPTFLREKLVADMTVAAGLPSIRVSYRR